MSIIRGTKQVALSPRSAGIDWLLRDEFSYALAAGAVDDTLATHVGLRDVVTDTNSKLSIAGGVASFATGGSAGGDPGLWYELISSLAGRLIIGSITPSDTSSNGAIGLDTNQATTIRSSIRFLNPGALNVLDDNTSTSVGAFSATKYYACIVRRVFGHYYFIKGGAFTNWTLLYIGSSGGGVYPAVVANGTADVFTSSFIRIPVETFLPTPLAYDTFTRDNGAIGSTEHYGPDSQRCLDRVWTGATWTIATNKAVNTPTLGDELAAGNLVVGNWYSITASDADHFYVGSAIGDTFRADATTGLDAGNKVRLITLATLFATIPDFGTTDVLADADLVNTAATQNGVITNLDDAATPANFLLTYHDGTNANLVKCVGGVYTSLISAAAAYGAGRTLRLIVTRVGADLKARLYYHNAFIGAEQTISDAGIIDNTICGMFSTSNLNTLDNFSVFPRGQNDDSYRGLDKWSFD